MKITMLKKPLISGGDAETGDEILLPYAGRKLAVQVVDTIGGWYKPGYASADAICRSQTGEYFLAREIYLEPLGEGKPEFHLPGAGCWLRVKRLSLPAAALYISRPAASVYKEDLLKALQKSSDAAGSSGNTFGVSQATFDAAAKYAAKNGRTVEEMLADVLRCVAGNGSGVEEAKVAASMVAREEEHVLTLRLSAEQYALLREVTEYDNHESLEEGVMEELREHVVTCFEGGCSDEKVEADEIRSRWDGDEAEINGAVERMRLMLGDGTTLNAVDARQETEAA